MAVDGRRIDGKLHHFTMNHPASDDIAPPKPKASANKPTHSSYPRDTHTPGTFSVVAVKSKTRECVKQKAALSKPDEKGERAPLYKKNGQPAMQCEEWRNLAPRKHGIQGATVVEAPPTKRKRTVSATAQPKRATHMVDDPYDKCESKKRYVGACVPMARMA